MITRLSVSFKLRQSKSLPNGTAPIYMSIAIGEERVELSTKKYVLPQRWNSAMQKVSGTGEDARTINTSLKTMEQEMFQAHQALILENKEVTASNIKAKLLGQDTEQHWIIEEFKDHNKKMEASGEYPFPHLSHEPRIQELHDHLVHRGHQPFYMPIAVKLNEADRLNSECIRCNTCDGYPCMIHAKSDADINCVRPSLANDNVTLLTGAKVERLVTTANGKEIDYIEVTYNDEPVRFKASIVVVAGGAINSAALLLKSADDNHPQGLANSSGQVGRNFMKHLSAAMLGLSTTPNPTKFQKTLAVNDYYWGEPGFAFPMGHIQLLGKSDKDQISPDAPAITPGFVLSEMASHSIDWWFTSEDLPVPDNRVQVVNGQIHLDYKVNNTEGFERLINRWKHVLGEIYTGHIFLDHGIYLSKDIPLAGVAHQVGTCRFGTDPATSVLDIHCKTHDIENLYVVDGSFFPSIGAVNPSLTIMANALRVG